MSSLQILISSILGDLINARFEADVKAAELAQHYKSDPTLSALNVPTLNITDVTVDLRLVFDNAQISDAEGPSEAQVTAVAEGTQELRSKFMAMESVRAGVPNNRRRAGISRSMASKLTAASTANLAKPSNERIASVNREFSRFMSDHQISLSDVEKQALREALGKFDNQLAAAPKNPPKSLPNILVGAEAIANVDPNAISSIKFNVDLSDARWLETDDPAGGVTSVLSES